MTQPYQNTTTARLIADRIRDLAHKKTQAEIASEAGFPNSNMMTFLKNGRNKVPLDRVPSLAKALEVDPAYLMRLAVDQCFVITVADAADRRFDACLGLPFAVFDRQILVATVAVMDQPYAVDREAFMDGLFEGLENEPGMRRGADPPADDLATVCVNDESDISKPLPLQHIVALSGVLYRNPMAAMALEPGGPQIWTETPAFLDRIGVDPEGLAEWYGPTVGNLLLEGGIVTDDASRLRLIQQTRSRRRGPSGLSFAGAGCRFSRRTAFLVPDPQAACVPKQRPQVRRSMKEGRRNENRSGGPFRTNGQ